MWCFLVLLLSIVEVHGGYCTRKDQSRPAACYADEFPQALERSRAIFRVWIKFEVYVLSHCTAWMVGDEGHVLTNHHCVDSQEMANEMLFEIMGQGSTCEDSCKEGAWPCRGPETISVPLELLQTSSELDYSLLRLPSEYRHFPEKYGYLQLRNASAVLHESVYVPQHPLGYGKRIAAYQNGTLSSIQALEAPGFNNCGQVQYLHNADTTSGSSGSPVIAHRDHAVVALHHCSGCDTLGHNGAVPSTALIKDFCPPLPASAIA